MKKVKIEYEPPLGWQATLNKIKQMREGIVAPVDTVGCHRLATSKDPETRRKAFVFSFRFQVLVALMLSSQTKDQITSVVMQKLGSSLSINTIIATPQAELEEIIKPVSFYKRKSLFLKEAAVLLKEK